MKSAILFLIYGLFFISCANNQTKLEKANSIYEDLVYSEKLNKDSSYSTPFGIYLTINSKDFKRKIDSLIQLEELGKEGEDYFYYFDINTPEKTTIKASYHFAFENDSLYHIGLGFEDVESLNNSSIIKNKISAIYFDKYGSYGSKNFVLIPYGEDEDQGDLVWVKGNSEIRLRRLNNHPLGIVYSFLPTKKKLEILNDKQDSVKKEKIKRVL